MSIDHHYKWIAVVATIFCFSCTSKKAVEEQTQEKVKDAITITLTPDQFKTAGIELGSVETRTVSDGIRANGVLDVPPQNLVTISAPMGGFVTRTDLLQGMKVKKGQQVASLEGPEFVQLQEDYLSNKSQLEFLQLEYQRQQDLAKENINAAKILQQSRSAYLSTRAKVEGLKARLRFINIDADALENGAIQSSVTLYSPIEGFVAQVNVNLGMHVNPADMMFKIVDTDHLHAEAQVFERDITMLKIGQKVRITLSNDPHERTATVYLIGKEITPERTVRVHCHLDAEDPMLIPGMYFSAVFEVVNHPVPSLPEQAIVTFDGKTYIFVSSGDATRLFEMVPVKTGLSESGYTAVILPSGAMEGKSVVIKGAYELLSRLKNNEE